jgi:hypothetical protein
MTHLTDPAIRQAAAKRALAIQEGHGLSKKKASQDMARRIAESTERWKARGKLERETRRHQSDILAEVIGKNATNEKVQRSIVALRQIALRAANQKVRPPAGPREYPRITAGSVLDFFVPPYWNIWTSTSAGNASANANSDKGTFGGSAAGFGQTNYAYAGVAGAYFPVSDSPMGHFRPYLRYSYNWLDASVWYTAHSDGYMYAAVYDYNSSGNLVQWPPAEQSVTLWQDGTGWLDTHSDSDDGAWPGVIDVMFPLTPGHSYALWVWSEVVANDAGAQGLGWSFAQDTIQCACPFMVVEETQG